MKLAIVLTAIMSAQSSGPAKPRVYVTDNPSWAVHAQTASLEIQGNGGGSGRTIEIIRNFGDRCPNVIVTAVKDKADYVAFVYPHDGGRAKTDYAVFSKNGDSVRAGSARLLSNAVKDACKVIADNWKIVARQEASQ